MKVAEMLVILKVEQIIGFSSNGNFSLLWYLDNGIMSRSFNDGEGKIVIDKTGLELIGTHLNDHFLNRIMSTW